MVKVKLTWCFLVGCLQTAASLYTGCSPGTHRVVSYDTSLVPPLGVWASSEDTTFNPDNYLFHRSNVPLRLWCSQSFEEAMSDGEEDGGGGGGAGGTGLLTFENFTRNFYILVNFSKPLLLTHVITSGFSNGYVNNFTIQYSVDSDGLLALYAYSEITEEFISNQVDTVFQLREPLAALRLRFNINDGLMTPSGRLCWHLTLLGCTVLEALDASFDPIDASESNLATMPPLICPTEATSTAIHTSTEERVETRTDREDRGETEIQREATEGNRCGHTPPAAATTPTTVSPTPATSVTQDPDLLILVLPTSVAIVLALLILIILLGVCICWRCSPAMWRKESGRTSTDAIASNDTLGMVDNDLYRSRSSIFPMSVNHTGAVATDKNAVAAATTAQSGEAVYENGNEQSGSTLCTYSNLFPHYKESGFYESITTRHPEIEQSVKSIESMVDNPNYSVPFPLSHRPLDTTQEEEEVSTPPPPPLPRFPPRVVKTRIGASMIDMVDNECYSVPAGSRTAERPEVGHGGVWRERGSFGSFKN